MTGAARRIAQIVVAFEVGALGQDHVCIAGHFRGHGLHDDHEIQRIRSRSQLVRNRRNRLRQVGAVNQPALEEGILADRRIDDAVGNALARKRPFAWVGVAVVNFRLRIVGQRVLRKVDFLRNVETAFAVPRTEQGVQHRDGPAALRVVAVPNRMAPWVHDGRRCRLRHFARRLANHFRANTGFQVNPLRRVVAHVLGQLLEADRVAFEIVCVAQVFADQHVHPRKQQGNIGARLDRQPVFRLARRNREARIDGNQRDVFVDRLGECLHLCVVQVFADVRTQQHDAVRIGHVGALRRARGLAEGQPEANVTGTAALGECGFGMAVRAISAQQMQEMAAAGAMMQHEPSLWPGVVGDALHLLADEIQSLVPGHFLERLSAIDGHPHQRFLEPVRDRGRHLDHRCRACTDGRRCAGHPHCR